MLIVCHDIITIPPWCFFGCLPSNSIVIRSPFQLVPHVNRLNRKIQFCQHTRRYIVKSNTLWSFIHYMDSIAATLELSFGGQFYSLKWLCFSINLHTSGVVFKLKINLSLCRSIALYSHILVDLVFFIICHSKLWLLIWSLLDCVIVSVRWQHLHYIFFLQLSLCFFSTAARWRRK